MAGDSNEGIRDRLLSRPLLPLPIPTITTDKTLTTRVCLFCGWSLRETTGSAPATAEFHGGTDTTNPIVGEEQMASGTAGTKHLGTEGVLCESGLMIHVISGSVTGVAYVRV